MNQITEVIQSPNFAKLKKKLKENPFVGKALEKELSGYYSLKSKRFRIIYKIVHQSHIVQIHYIGHRKDIYEIFKDILDTL